MFVIDIVPYIANITATVFRYRSQSHNKSALKMTNKKHIKCCFLHINRNSYLIRSNKLYLNYKPQNTH